MLTEPGTDVRLRPIGRVRSPWKDRDDTPKQGRDSSVTSVLELLDPYRDGEMGLENEESLIVLTWFHLADRDTLQVHPKGDPANPLRGVFATRSPDRPNPIGHHVVEVVRYEPGRIELRHMEAWDGTPILDIKPAVPRLDKPQDTEEPTGNDPVDERRVKTPDRSS